MRLAFTSEQRARKYRVFATVKDITANARERIPMQEKILHLMEIRSAVRMQSVKMKSYKNVITAMNCQRQVAFSNTSEMFPCGSQLVAALLFALQTCSIFYVEMRREISHRERQKYNSI